MEQATKKKSIVRRLWAAAESFERETTTLIGSLWWIVLWTAYIGAAILEPYMTDMEDYWPGAPIFLVLIVMVLTCLYEALEGWLGTPLMNCVISLPVVPVLFIINVVRMIMGPEEWSGKQRAWFLAAQLLALILTWLHFLYTRKCWREEPPARLRLKVRSKPYKPSLEGSVQWAIVYLLFVLYCAGIYILVLTKKVWLYLHVPVYFLAMILLVLFVIAAFSLSYLIRKKLLDR